MTRLIIVWLIISNLGISSPSHAQDNKSDNIYEIIFEKGEIRPPFNNRATNAFALLALTHHQCGHIRDKALTYKALENYWYEKRGGHAIYKHDTREVVKGIEDFISKDPKMTKEEGQRLCTDKVISIFYEMVWQEALNEGIILHSLVDKLPKETALKREP
jgi:hypothetical protein